MNPKEELKASVENLKFRVRELGVPTEIETFEALSRFTEKEFPMWWKECLTNKDNLKDDTGAIAPQELSLVLSGVEADPAAELKILDISVTGVDLYTISWTSVVGATYQIETLPDLATGVWTTLAGDYVATKDVTAAEITSNPGEDRRSWRGKRLP